MSEISWPGEYALVALGGYGRSELSPYSDIDLMVLHDADDPSDLAARVFRPLWDANLKVGHSIRTIREAAAAARERFETHTTLITSRLVSGSDEMFESLSAEVAAVTRARPLRRHLVREERERRRLSPYIRMATDVKHGRGGLRTLQAFDWVAAREKMVGRYSAGQLDEEDLAYETLLRVRNALHVAAGRRYDVYAHELRDPVARWLGASTFDVADRLIDAVETADRIATRRWPEVTEEEVGVFKKLRRSRNFKTDRAPTARELADILRSGERGRLAFDLIRQEGHLDEILPEWEGVLALPQLEPFHDHPVDAHLWRTVDEMQDLVDGEDGHYRRAASEVGSDLALTLAAFLHDIGKGRGGDHSEVGAEIARSVCERLGCSEDVTGLVVTAVEHHLLLGRTAARRDIDDPVVIDDLASTLGDLRSLQMLYLLTVADSRATGPAMWSDWKATLLRTLFLRVARRLGADEPDEDAPGARQMLLAEVPPEMRHSVEQHLTEMPDEYPLESTREEVLWHADRVSALSGGSMIDVVPGDVADRLLVIGRPRPGFRQIVAEILAANGIDVLQARLRSRGDGVTVDSFVVHDDRTGGTVGPERWGRVREDIDSALAGDLDTTSKVAVRADAYERVDRRGDIRPQVRIYRDPATEEPVITVRCEDRIGRLAELLSVLTGVGIEIRLAKLDNRAGELIDTFHVRDEAIPKDLASLEELERAIASALEA